MESKNLNKFTVGKYFRKMKNLRKEDPKAKPLEITEDM